MSMSRKDYRAIAEAIVEARRLCQGIHAPTVINILAARIAEHFEADNPRFDRERFLVAAGSPTSDRVPHVA